MYNPTEDLQGITNNVGFKFSVGDTNTEVYNKY